jgi:hypothetical protein
MDEYMPYDIQFTNNFSKSLYIFNTNSNNTIHSNKDLLYKGYAYSHETIILTVNNGYKYTETPNCFILKISLYLCGYLFQLNNIIYQFQLNQLIKHNITINNSYSTDNNFYFNILAEFLSFIDYNTSYSYNIKSKHNLYDKNVYHILTSILYNYNLNHFVRYNSFNYSFKDILLPHKISFNVPNCTILYSNNKLDKNLLYNGADNCNNQPITNTQKKLDIKKKPSTFYTLNNNIDIDNDYSLLLNMNNNNLTNSLSKNNNNNTNHLYNNNNNNHLDNNNNNNHLDNNNNNNNILKYNTNHLDNNNNNILKYNTNHLDNNNNNILKYNTNHLDNNNNNDDELEFLFTDNDISKHNDVILNKFINLSIDNNI